jgi:hypothetical protein
MKTGHSNLPTTLLPRSYSNISLPVVDFPMKFSGLGLAGLLAA